MELGFMLNGGTSWLSVGWIDTHTKKYLRLFTTKYKDAIELADKIVIPVGCIKDIKVI
jgi:hypothetical protein